MISKCTFVVDDVVMELFTAGSKRERQEMLRIFRFLADNPYQKGEWLQKGKTGREFQVKRFGKWLVSFWLDTPVFELRIVDVKKVSV